MRRKLEDRYNTELIGEIMHIAQGNEHFSIDFFDKKGGAWKRRLHYHDFYELEFVISGSAANVINGMRFELSRGMMFLIRPTDVHGYEIDPGEEISVCTVRFTWVRNYWDNTGNTLKSAQTSLHFFVQKAIKKNRRFSEFSYYRAGLLFKRVSEIPDDTYRIVSENDDPFYELLHQLVVKLSDVAQHIDHSTSFAYVPLLNLSGQ